MTSMLISLIAEHLRQTNSFLIVAQQVLNRFMEAKVDACGSLSVPRKIRLKVKDEHL